MKLSNDLSCLVHPKSICIVGATENSIFVQKIVNNLGSQGYNGKLYMVNPKYKLVFGYPAYPTVLEIPHDVENAIFLIPAKLILDAVKQCVEKGVKSITIVTSGFAENGRVEGGKLQEQIKDIALMNNMLVCGPNCFGIISSHGQVSNFCENIPGRLGKGNIGIVMQSGGLLASTVHLAQLRGIDFSYFISSGNEAVLESSDYIRFMLDDPHTDVICAFIEGIRDKKRFIEVADLAMKKRKPLIAIKIGSSVYGSQTAFRHTGSISGSDLEFQALCKDMGIIRANDLDDLIETAALFAKIGRQWPKPGRRIAVMAISGGGAGLISDIGADEGFEFPELSEETFKYLSGIVPEFGFVANPLDVTTQVLASPAIYLECAEHLLKDKDIDVLAFAWALGIPKEPGPVVTIIEGLSRIIEKTDKLCLMFSIMGLNDFSKELLKKVDIPFIQGTRRAFRAVHSLIDYDMKSGQCSRGLK
jgi:acyl-CoA synthetase (NDP forming)